MWSIFFLNMYLSIRANSFIISGVHTFLAQIRIDCISIIIANFVKRYGSFSILIYYQWVRAFTYSCTYKLHLINDDQLWSGYLDFEELWKNGEILLGVFYVFFSVYSLPQKFRNHPMVRPCQTTRQTEQPRDTLRRQSFWHRSLIDN